MALTAKLQFGDNESRHYSSEYLLTDFKCRLVRHHNEARPDGGTTCDQLDLTVIAPGRDDLSLMEWYTGSFGMNGRILVEMPAAGPNQPSRWKEILFEDAVCYAIAEDYHIDVDSRRSLRLGLAVGSLTVEETVFTAS